MEVGAVKQAFNNEIIQLKNKVNQAKIQTIHKLTRKAKTFTEKKAPEKLKDKLKRKAESAVQEVLIIKKIKPRDLAKFTVTHTGKLQDYLNKPTVDNDKACARLLLHKSLQAKYNSIRNTFANVPINDLLMSRLERRKLKKEAKEKEKEKRKNKGKKDVVVNSEGDWDVENVKSVNEDLTEMNGSIDGSSESDKDENKHNSDDEAQDNDENSDEDDDGPQLDERSETDDENRSEMESNHNSDIEIHTQENNEEEDMSTAGLFVKSVPSNTDEKAMKPSKSDVKNNKTSPVPNINKPEKKKSAKAKDVNKKKNLEEKILNRKFKKETEELPVLNKKIADPFFITSTGENYMSLAEPRQPDEVKEIHKQGNRKIRRAAMFGHVPKIKPRQDNFRTDNNKFNRQNGNQNDGGFKKNTNYGEESRFKNDFNNKSNFNKNGSNTQYKGKSSEPIEPKVEKLHPSWEAKKKQSGILPFKGKKIVFDES